MKKRMVSLVCCLVGMLLFAGCEVEGWGMVQSEWIEDLGNGHAEGEDPEGDMCAYTCSEHCVSLGGEPMVGTCDGELRCCDFSQLEEEPCAYECSESCFSIGGTMMEGTCDGDLKCCDFSQEEETPCAYECTVHCVSVGGTVMEGICDDDLKCCDLSDTVVIE